MHGAFSTGNKITGIEEIDIAIERAGYAFDPQQDIFYSSINSWQRNMGYCRLYDEAAASVSIIMDCEPIYFEYGGKRWLVEFWKGQYALATGCEVGIYTTDGPDLSIPGMFNGTFYNCANDDELLWMTCSLKKNGKIIFERSAKHWWLTGLKLGEFSQPYELLMNLSITFKDREMCNAFLTGLMDAGYSREEVFVLNDTVNIEFNKPRTPQPISRTRVTDYMIQLKNKLLCHIYQEITGPYGTFPQKIQAIQEKNSWLMREILKIGKTTQIFEAYDELKDYLD